MAGRLDNGTEFEFGIGDVFDIAPGHDAWVIGKEPVVLLQFGFTTTSKQVLILQWTMLKKNFDFHLDRKIKKR